MTIHAKSVEIYFRTKKQHAEFRTIAYSDYEKM